MHTSGFSLYRNIRNVLEKCLKSGRFVCVVFCHCGEDRRTIRVQSKCSYQCCNRNIQTLKRPVWFPGLVEYIGATSFPDTSVVRGD